MTNDSIDQSVNSAVRTLTIETQALMALRDAFESTELARTFSTVVDKIVQLKGHIVLSGMGKSGLIGRKIAATLASTGTPSFFVHPADASHGDLGMITGADIVLALSWSGETSELSDIVNHCARCNVPLICMTSSRSSSLAQRAAITLLLPRVQEACPHDLAPTSSTTVQTAFGDALAVAVLERKRFTPDAFKAFHPKGNLAAQLVNVGDVMTVGKAVPKITETSSITFAILEMSAKRLGITAVVETGDHLIGAFSDGDLRRALAHGLLDHPVRDYMTRSPRVVGPEMLVSQALAIMNAHNISQLFVCVDERLMGIVHVHDILRVGVL